MSTARTIDVLADPAKMVTLLALGTFPAQEKVGFLALADRCNDLQGAYKTRDIIKATVVKHCKSALSTAGLVELGQAATEGGKSFHTVGLSEKGATVGVAISGAMLGLQLETPQEGFLETVMSVRADVARDNPRPLIYEKLLDGPASVMDIARFAGISPAQTTHFVQVLTEGNVLSHRSLIDPANREYQLAQGEFPVTTKASPVSGFILKAALTLRSNDHTTVTGQDLLDEVGRTNPRVPQETVWKALLTWMQYGPHRNGLIRPLAGPSTAKSEVSITPDFESSIKAMLERRRLLLGTDAQAAAFQARARQDAHEIINSPELVAQVLAYRSGFRIETSTDSWMDLAEQIYAANSRLNVPLEELHQQAMAQAGRRINMRTFCQRIIEAPSLLLRYQSAQRRGSRLAKYVTGKQTMVPADWVHDAACRDEDPELFFPRSTAKAFTPQAERAKRICQSCPVTIPCLKTALDEPVPTGIRGGVWLDKANERTLTPELKKQLALITISRTAK